MPTLQLQLIALALSISLSAFGGWKVHSWYDASEREQYELGQAAALQATATEIAKIEIKNVTIKQQLRTEFHDHPVAMDCGLSDDGLRLVAAAFGEQPAGAVDYKLPAASPTGGRTPGNDHGKAGGGSGAVSPVSPSSGG